MLLAICWLTTRVCGIAVFHVECRNCVGPSFSLWTASHACSCAIHTASMFAEQVGASVGIGEVEWGPDPLALLPSVVFSK